MSQVLVNNRILWRNIVESTSFVELALGVNQKVHTTVTGGMRIASNRERTDEKPDI